MVNPAQQDLLVLGCAGSGKTMILLHRLSYLLYNNPDIHPEDIYVISPTQYLNIECGLLSQTLSLENINQYVVKQLYRDIVVHFYSGRNADLYIADKIASLYSLGWSAEKIASVYSQESMAEKTALVGKILRADTQERKAFIREYGSCIEAMCARFPQEFGEEITIQTLCDYVAAFIEECNTKQYSLANLKKWKGSFLSEPLSQKNCIACDNC
jgi:DNA helicase IV